MGARAADELLEELDERVPEDEPRVSGSAASGSAESGSAESGSSDEPPPSAWRRWSEARRAKKAEREREAQAARAEKAIDDELDALKRKLGR
ncbi:MAG: hypothetical protein RIF41_15255 [Polyangiaceae bacterium]